MKLVRTAKTFSITLIVLLILLIAYNLIVPSLMQTEGFVESAATISDSNFKKIKSVELTKKDFQNGGTGLKQSGYDKVAEKIVDASVAKKKDSADLAKSLSSDQVSTLYKSVK